MLVPYVIEFVRLQTDFIGKLYIVKLEFNDIHSHFSLILKLQETHPVLFLDL